MATIIRGTTPTISFNYSKISVTDITTAILTVKQGGQILIEKDLTTADIGESSISWTLSQSETLALKSKLAIVAVCDWVLTDGTRGRSKELNAETGEPGKNEVI